MYVCIYMYVCMYVCMYYLLSEVELNVQKACCEYTEIQNCWFDISHYYVIMQ